MIFNQPSSTACSAFVYGCPIIADVMVLGSDGRILGPRMIAFPAFCVGSHTTATHHCRFLLLFVENATIFVQGSNSLQSLTPQVSTACRKCKWYAKYCSNGGNGSRYHTQWRKTLSNQLSTIIATVLILFWHSPCFLRRRSRKAH